MQGSFHVGTTICEKFCTVVHSPFYYGIYQTTSSVCGGHRSWQSQEAGNILMRVSYQTFRQHMVKYPVRFIDEEHKTFRSQSYWDAISCLPTTESETTGPMLSPDGNDDVPMTEVSHRTPATCELDLGDSIEANRSTREEYGESEICFGAVRHIARYCIRRNFLIRSIVVRCWNRLSTPLRT